MARPRNALYRPLLESLEERVVPYTLSGYKWANVNVSASFLPDGTITDGGSPSALFTTLNAIAPTATWQREFARALQTWASVTPLNFHFVSDNGAASGTSGSSQGDSRFGDIRLGAYSSTTWSGYAYFPAGGTLGGDAYVNTAVAWHLGANPDLYSILLHESGHTLGLDHTSIYPAVMRPSISTVYTGLLADDIAGIQAIYGARQADAYDSGAGNNGFASATALTVNGSGLATANADLTTVSDVDYFRMTAPAGFDGTLTVSVDARNLSLLTPKISVYDAAQNLLGTVSATTYGSVATVNLSGLAAGQTYYLVADGATSDVFGMSAYKLNAQFGNVSSLPSLTINNVSLSEGDSGIKQLAFTVSLSAASSSTVTVQYATADNTATTANNDYTATNGTLSFAPGETQKSIAVSVNGDTTIEPDETLFVDLTNPSNASLGDNQGQGTIQNDDAPLPSLSINSVSVTESNSGTATATFTVTLSAASNSIVTVQYNSADGTATAGSDYEVSSGTLSFAPGETQKTIAVTINGDSTPEGNETFAVNLSAPSNATLGTSAGTGTIQNDDIAPDRYELNDTSVIATNFGSTNAVSQAGVTLHTAADGDYYRFTPTKKLTFKFKLTPSQGSGKLDLAVLNAQQTVLGSAESQTGEVSVTLNLAAGKQYFVKANSLSGSLFTYDLSIAKSGGRGGAAIVADGHGQEHGDELGHGTIVGGTLDEIPLVEGPTKSPRGNLFRERLERQATRPGVTPRSARAGGDLVAALAGEVAESAPFKRTTTSKATWATWDDAVWAELSETHA